jgi:hypothetical protein
MTRLIDQLVVDRYFPLLDRAAIAHAFRRLGDRLARRGVVADLYLRWRDGAGLPRPSVDAISMPHAVVIDEARLRAGRVGAQVAEASFRRVTVPKGT